MWDTRVIAGGSSRVLVDKVCKRLGISPCRVKLKRFADGENFVQIEENVRGKNVFIFQSTSSPVNDNLMELLLLVDACKRSSAQQIIVVLPYYGYCRQDKRQKDARVPIAAKLVANLISTTGAHRVLTLELNAMQVQGFFDIPLDHIKFQSCLTSAFLELKREYQCSDEEMVIVAAGKRATQRAKELADSLNWQLAVIDGRKGLPEDQRSHVRTSSSVELDQQTSVSNLYLLGSVEGKCCVMIDGTIDTAVMPCHGETLLRDHKASRVILSAVHAPLIEEGVNRLMDSTFDLIITSDSIDLSDFHERMGNRLRVLSTAELFSEAIRRIHFEEPMDEDIG